MQAPDAGLARLGELCATGGILLALGTAYSRARKRRRSA
jgi:hypothetical protein